MKGIINFRSLRQRWYRYRHPQSYHHNAKIWPYIRISRDESGRLQQIHYRQQLVKTLSLPELKPLQTTDLVIVASGPSAAQIDLNLLKQADVLVVNGAVQLLKNMPNRDIQYYMVIDQGFVQDKIAMMAPILAQEKTVFITTVFCLNKVYELLGQEAVKARLWVLEECQKPVYLPKPSAEELQQQSMNTPEVLYWDNKQNVGFSLNIERCYVGGGTVVYPALQVAAALGYQRIFLVGVDMTRFNQPRFYENTANQLPTKLDVDFESVIQPSFVLASRLLQAQGVQVLNTCVDSGLGDEVFERVDLGRWMQVNQE